MNRRLHKIASIVLILGLFALPFYMIRNQIGASSNDAYLVGAVGSLAPQPVPAKPLPLNSTVNFVGQDFLGDKLTTSSPILSRTLD